MDKLKLAHDWAMKIIEGNVRAADASDLIEHAWQYADAMQAEAEKRNKAEAEQKRKEIREILSDANTFIEREGQHFDDVEEWQPDWSQAPSGALSYHIELDELDGSIQPFWTDSLETHFDGEMFVGYKCAWNAPSFGYTGNWKESLRKRPQ